MARSINLRGTTKETLATNTSISPLGTRLHVPGGRVFRRAKAGEALNAGDLVQIAAPSFNTLYSDLSISTLPLIGGAKSVQVNVGSTVLAKNFYQDGFMYVNNGTLEGRVYGINSNTNQDGNGDGIITVYLDSELDPDNISNGAFDSTTRITLVKNEYDSILRSVPYTHTLPVGVAATTVAKDSFFWVQTYGPAAVKQAGPLIIGTAVGSSPAIKGAISSYLTPVSLSDSVTTVSGGEVPQGLTATGLPNIPTMTSVLTNMELTIPSNAFPADEQNSDADINTFTTGVGALANLIVGYVIDSRLDTEKALIRLTILN